MKPRHAALISLLLAFSVAVGAVAAERTMATASGAGAKSTRLSPVLVRRAHALDRMEASLRKALAQRPPKLPRMPHFRSVPVATSAHGAANLARTSSRSAAPRTIFVRPPAHVVIVHRHGGEHDDGESEDGHASLTTSHGSHEGGGGDD